jgi:hypothetical protein
MITVTCNECGNQLEVSKELTGKRIRCPKCQTTQTVVVDPEDEADKVYGLTESAPSAAAEAEDAAETAETDEPVRREGKRKKRRAWGSWDSRKASAGMTGEEHVKKNGDVIWRVEYVYEEWSHYTLFVLTREELFVGHYMKPPKFIGAWNSARKAHGDYAKALGSQAVRIAWSDVTRVEYGPDYRDLPCVKVCHGSRSHAIEAPDELEIFYRLHDLMAPEAKIRKMNAGIWNRILMPVLYMVMAVIFASCCCGLTFIPSTPRANPDTVRTRGQSAMALAKEFGPWGIAAVLFVTLVILLIVLILRLMDQVLIRYFEVQTVAVEG